MQLDTVKRLIELNLQFYQTFAVQFSATRQRIQPGVRLLIERISAGAVLLDLGCGNGELWRVLQKTDKIRHYTGLDFSPPLLEFAGDPKTHQAEPFPAAIFVQGDLADPGWTAHLPLKAYDTIFAFAVLHHLPGYALRLQVLRQVRQLLAPGGFFFHSEWQFLNSPRLRARLQPWELVNMTADQVDAGDFLLDWRQGGTGLRYVHHFDLAELEQLAQDSDFQIADTFFSDGEGCKLSLYQVWESPAK